MTKYRFTIEADVNEQVLAAHDERAERLSDPVLLSPPRLLVPRDPQEWLAVDLFEARRLGMLRTVATVGVEEIA